MTDFGEEKDKNHLYFYKLFSQTKKKLELLITLQKGSFLFNELNYESKATFSQKKRCFTSQHRVSKNPGLT